MQALQLSETSTEEQDIANTFNDHFITIGHGNPEGIKIDHSQMEESQNQKYSKEFQPTTEEKMNKIILRNALKSIPSRWYFDCLNDKI